MSDRSGARHESDSLRDDIGEGHDGLLVLVGNRAAVVQAPRRRRVPVRTREVDGQHHVQFLHMGSQGIASGAVLKRQAALSKRIAGSRGA